MSTYSIRAHVEGCPKALRVPVDLCECGGRDFTPEPREAASPEPARSVSVGSSPNMFHVHLDLCDHCRRHPFDLCPDGQHLLKKQVEQAAARSASRTDGQTLNPALRAGQTGAGSEPADSQPQNPEGAGGGSPVRPVPQLQTIDDPAWTGDWESAYLVLAEAILPSEKRVKQWSARELGLLASAHRDDTEFMDEHDDLRSAQKALAALQDQIAAIAQQMQERMPSCECGVCRMIREWADHLRSLGTTK